LTDPLPIRVASTAEEELRLGELEETSRAIDERFDAMESCESTATKPPFFEGDVFTELGVATMAQPPRSSRVHDRVYSLFRYDDCSEVLRNGVVFSSDIVAAEQFAGTILCLDGTG
jgi:hypothetical protein